MKKLLIKAGFENVAKPCDVEKIVSAIFETSKNGFEHFSKCEKTEICKIEFPKNFVLHIRDFQKSYAVIF